MDAVETVFEDFRTKLNVITIQHPQHSVFNEVMSMVETMIAPIIADNPDMEQVFAESIKSTVQTVMPWNHFLKLNGD